MIPHEIKKALMCCAESDTDCDVCPYRDKVKCASVLRSDALKYILMLESKPYAMFNAEVFILSALRLVRNVCKEYRHCDECPLSDSRGVCPFSDCVEQVTPENWPLEEIKLFKREGL